MVRLWYATSDCVSLDSGSAIEDAGGGLEENSGYVFISGSPLNALRQFKLPTVGVTNRLLRLFHLLLIN